MEDLDYGLYMAATDWDLAGYTDDVKGKIAKPIPSGRLLVPGKIWLDERNLKWELAPSSDLLPLDRQAPKTLLNSFVRLWSSSDQQIERFAKNHGVLGGDSISGIEPLDKWRKLSRQACALLNIGAVLEQNKQVDPNEWKWIRLFEDKHLDQLRKLSASRFQLVIEVRHWLNPIDGLGFSMTWNRGRKQFELEVDYGAKMLNAVALQLALAISKSDSLYICSGCKYPYSRSAKHPKSGQANFCPECSTPIEGRSSEPLRQADARRKAKMAEAKRLYEAGTPLNEIAVQLKVRDGATTVQSWAKKGNWHDEKTRSK